jgi:hypothetical protein
MTYLGQGGWFLNFDEIALKERGMRPFDKLWFSFITNIRGLLEF